MRRKTPIILVTIALISLVMLSCTTAKIPEVGDNAPDFTLESIEDKSISLSDFRGKVVLLVFTKIDCEDCQKQIPYIEAAYEKSNGGFAVLDIYQFDAPNKVKDYVAGKQLTAFPALPDPKGKVAIEYGVARFPPTNFIVDAAGIIRYKQIGPFQSQEEIEGILESL
ncbi:peroxiredoxin family protein [Chloroflexota bacterium]